MKDILKYLFFLVLGIIFYILLNGKDGFSVGIRLVRYFDSESKNYYYYNTETGLSTWEYPDPTGRTTIYPGSLDGPPPPLPSTPAPEPIGDVGGGASAEGIDAGVGGGGVCSAGFISKIFYGSNKLDEGSLQRLQIYLSRGGIISDLTRSLIDSGFLYTSETPNFTQIFDDISLIIVSADSLPDITGIHDRDFLMRHGHNATRAQQEQIKRLCRQMPTYQEGETLTVVDPAGKYRLYGQDTRYIVYSETKVYLFKIQGIDYTKTEVINSIIGEILDISPLILDYGSFSNESIIVKCFVHKKLINTPANKIQEYRDLLERSSPYGIHTDYGSYGTGSYHNPNNILYDELTGKFYFIDMVSFQFSSSYYLIT
jgi:hypothetical protein